jgi:drug/metabolite transporter (DMT)-like permease
MKQNQFAYIQMHAAVLLFGFTAILGDLISLSAIVLVWWRVLITPISLLFFTQMGQTLKNLTKHQIFVFLGIGMLIGLHWVCFFGAVKLSSVSLCLVCMSTTSLFTAIIEPLLLHTQIKKSEILTSILIIPSMYLIVQNIDAQHVIGLWIGLLSALLAAIFSVLNKRHIYAADPATITMIEMSGAWVVISIMLIGMFVSNKEIGPFLPQSGMDWFYILTLALLCTTLAQNLTLRALKHLSTFSISLVTNLEPVYGIILAIILLNEHRQLQPMFYLGAGIILATVIVFPLLNPSPNPSN